MAILVLREIQRLVYGHYPTRIEKTWTRLRPYKGLWLYFICPDWSDHFDTQVSLIPWALGTENTDRVQEWNPTTRRPRNQVVCCYFQARSGTRFMVISLPQRDWLLAESTSPILAWSAWNHHPMLWAFLAHVAKSMQRLGNSGLAKYYLFSMIPGICLTSCLYCLRNRCPRSAMSISVDVDLCLHR